MNSDDRIREAVRRAREVYGPMTFEELQWLATWIPVGSSILELGCYKGQLTKLFCSIGYLVTTVDSGEGQPGEGLKNLKEVFENNLRYELGEFGMGSRLRNFWMTTERFGKIEDERRYSVTWIDADHSYDSVVHDIQLALRLTRPGGMICGHDYHYADVRNAVFRELGDHHVSLCHEPFSLQSPNKIWYYRIPV